MQVPGLLSTLPELAPEPRNMDVHCLVCAAVRYPPYVREQLALGDYLPGPHGQVVQQVELPPGQIEPSAVECRLVRLTVKPEPADDHRLAAAALVGCRPPEHRPDPRLDLAA